MLSREPTLDWALNSTFSFLISTFPPPEEETGSKVSETRAAKRQVRTGMTTRAGTWFMVNVDFGSAFGRHVAQVDLLVQDLDL